MAIMDKRITSWTWARSGQSFGCISAMRTKIDCLFLVCPYSRDPINQTYYTVLFSIPFKWEVHWNGHQE